ncbi:lysylphosphatidylglycerol synthase transmembrane domain-containing protein [Daejeonella sp.]|uniref:lysylphosphatidylglycerol synthase transmembrane domain-containing protein n=1 Tax=Daejeonella sp. TaxID=2805397 RepID=UPI0037BE2974
MKQVIAKSFKYLILLLIGLVLLYFAFKEQDLNLLFEDLRRAEYVWVFASVLFAYLAHLVRAYRWRMMISSLGHGTPSLTNTFSAVLIGYLANLAFPRMGEVSRCGVINKTDQIPIVKLIGTVVAERLIDLLMLGFIIFLAIAIQFGLLSDFLYNNLLIKLTRSEGYFTLLVFASCMLILMLVLFYIFKKREKLGIWYKIHKFYLDIKSGIFSIKAMGNKAGFIAYSILIWLMYGISVYLCFFALKATAELGPVVALSTLVFSSLAMIAPVQGGIGAFHWMVSEGLTIYGIERSEGLAFALLLHSFQTLIILFTGSISLILLFINSPKKIRNEEAGTN